MPELADNSIRKAAIFLRGLAPEAAKEMLTRLSSDEAKALRTALKELDTVDPEEQSQVAQELRESKTARLEPEHQVAPQTVDGVELQLGSSAVEASMEVQPTPPRPKVKPTVEPAETDWFESIRDAEPQAIATFLRAEQPRAAALVLSYLNPKLASDVLDQFPEEEQTRLLGLLSRQGDADPASVDVIAKELADWIRRQNDEKRRHADRIASIRMILAAAPNERRLSLVAQLCEEEPALADELGFAMPVAPELTAEIEEPTVSIPIGETVEPVDEAPPLPPSVPFEQLESLEPKLLMRALGRLDARTAMLSLVEASEELLNRIETRMTRRAAHEMRRRIIQIGPTSLAEIDQAQLALAYAAQQAAANQ